MITKGKWTVPGMSHVIAFSEDQALTSRRVQGEVRQPFAHVDVGLPLEYFVVIQCYRFSSWPASSFVFHP
jgi:hypothetical protein